MALKTDSHFASRPSDFLVARESPAEPLELHNCHMLCWGISDNTCWNSYWALLSQGVRHEWHSVKLGDSISMLGSWNGKGASRNHSSSTEKNPQMQVVISVQKANGWAFRMGVRKGADTELPSLYCLYCSLFPVCHIILLRCMHQWSLLVMWGLESYF